MSTVYLCVIMLKVNKIFLCILKQRQTRLHHVQARCKCKGQAAAPRWVPGTGPKCLTFLPLLVSPSWLWLWSLRKMIWMIVIWQLLVITSGQLSVSNTEKIQAKESSLPPTLQWYCIIMPCVARYAPLPVHNGLTIQANFPPAGLLWIAHDISD